MKGLDLAEFWALFSLAYPTPRAQLLSRTPLWEEAGTWIPSISQAAGMRDTCAAGAGSGGRPARHARMESQRKCRRLFGRFRSLWLSLIFLCCH